MLDEQGGKCGCILDDNFMYSWHIKKYCICLLAFHIKLKCF